MVTSDRALVAGVDGGNTKTIALVAQLDGTIAGAARGGCSDIYGARSAQEAIEELERTIATALDRAQARATALVAGAYSLAGADWPEDYAYLHAALEQRGYGRNALVTNDAIGALRAGAARGPAVAVVCGTGGATGARGVDGRYWHTSFWQEPHGAVDLGHKALRAVYRAELQIDPPTALTARALTFLGLPSVEAILHSFTAREGRLPHGAAAGLARLLLDEAAAGDAVARRIVIDHASAMGDYALAAARRVGIEQLPFTLVLAGGVVRHPSALFTERLVARVRAVSPGVRVAQSRFEPAVGALFLALETAGVVVGPDVIARVVASLPPPQLFMT